MATVTIDSGAFRNPNRDLFVNLQGTKPPAEDDYSYPKQDWWWTGKPPVHGQCPGVNKDGIITSLPLPDVNTASKQDLLDYFDNTWTLTEVLFSGLRGRDVFIRTPWHQLRHPLIFYYGHVACLYINKLRVAGLLTESVNEYIEQVMETGVDEMSWDDLSKNEMEWPDLRDVTEYRRTVYGIVKDLILNGDYQLPFTMDDPAWGIIMGFEHERIHLETSSVLMRELPQHLVTRPAQFPPYHPSAFDGSASKTPKNEMLNVKGETVQLGKPRDFPSFGWDNEYGTRTVEVKDFQASKFLITNGEYLEFVKAGGYVNRGFWTEAGWQWRTFRNILFPTFWVPDGPVGLHKYKVRLIFDVVDMPMSWPVDVNTHEARAYCAWKSSIDKPAHPYRLISEGEHNVIRDKATKDLSKGVKRDFIMVYDGFNCATNSNGDNKYNSNLAWGSQSPVDALAPSHTGHHDVFGNAWHWCEDDFNGLDGFEVHPLYTDFSTPCIDGLHQMILGGSFISTGDEASIWSRFHFRPHFHQHAGFRMVSAAQNEAKILPKQGTNGASNSANMVQGHTSAVDEEKMLDEHMLFHYGARMDVFPWENGPSSATGFPSRVAQLLVDAASQNGVAANRVMDLGCSVGGSSFELCSTFQEVVGIDVSSPYITAANEMKADGQRSYQRKEEGAVFTTLLASTDNDVDRTRVKFEVADPTALSPEVYGKFDAVLVNGLLERLHAPEACLKNLVAAEGVMKPGSLLVITSAGNWSPVNTPQSQWLGGYKNESGAYVSTLEGITSCLGSRAKMIRKEDTPLLVRNDNRQYSFSMVEVSVWKIGA